MYNDADQVESVTGPSVTLTHPSANSAVIQSVTEYDYDGPVVIQRRVKDIDALGVVNPNWIETDYTYFDQTDESGRLEMVESDLNGSDRSQVEFVYNARGERTEVQEHKESSPSQTSTASTVYDDRGLVYQTKQDTLHNDTSTPDTDRLVTEYDYDFAGRVVERLDPHGTETFETTYDDYGRRASETTAAADLGTDASANQVDGRFRTEWTYDDDGLVERVAKSTLQRTNGASWPDPEDEDNWSNSSTTIYDYDEAGRRNRTWKACITDPQEPPASFPDDWSEYAVDLHPGGQTDRTYIPGITTSISHQQEIDDLNRVTKKTSSTLNVIEYVYAGAGGQLSKEIATPYDDAAGAAGPSFARSCTYDEVGRVTEERFLGDESAGATPVVLGEHRRLPGVPGTQGA